MMNFFIFASIAFLGIIPLLHANNLTLTFEAIDNTCIAQCATPLDNTQLIQHLINATLNNTQAINDVMTKLDSFIVSLAQLNNSTDSNAGGINEILLLVEQILKIRNASSDDIMTLPASCQDIKNNQPDSPSGLYLLANSTGDNETKYVYCHMGELCGIEGGWTRLAYLNMSDSTENCPSGFGLYESGGVRACGRLTANSGSCVSVQFPSNVSYSQVCGRVVGYQFNTPDAVLTGPSFIPESHDDINSFYVDGVSITHGSPRQHVWTLMAGLFGSNSPPELFISLCPCSPNSTQIVQSFIGQDYFCESGATDTLSNILYTGDPLWDGEGCGALETVCCSFPGLPWFHKVLNSTTTDYIELRVCGDQPTADEDVPVGFYEIFVK